MYTITMKICQVAGCGVKHSCNGYCARHNAQVYRHGIVLARTNRDRNKIVIVDNYAKVLLYDRNSVPKAYAVIDIDCINVVKGIKWALNNTGYAYSYTLRTGMHNLLTGHKPTDHINRNKLDNRLSNLRKATLAENNRNTGGHKNSTSIYKGVSLDKVLKSKPYMSSICSKKIGRYTDEEEAAWMYDQYALAIFGEFAKLNFDYK